MIDVVIPLGNRSTVKNLELRYCLRGIQKHLKGVGQVFIIGECPEWLTGIIYIPHDDDPRSRYKERNIKTKIMTACMDEQLSNDFLMWHDDHFLLQDIEAREFPTVHHGIMNPGPGQYGQTKQNTMALFCDSADRIYDYDSHCPILFNTLKFMAAVSKLDWSKWYGYCLKTVYCISNGIQGEYYPDLKIRHMNSTEEIRGAIAGRRWFSIGDRCWAGGYMKEVLEELYPEKSMYEAN
jgi:hypothetical protein